MIYLVSSVIAFSILILIHEGGHFIVAKYVGMKVNEFALGMGPKIFGVQKGETLYTLRAIPIGGFIRPEGEDEESNDPRAFGNKPLWARAAVVAAGPIANFILAFVIIISLLTVAGLPVITVGEVTEGMPAASAGLKSGDVITKINGTNIFIFEELVDVVNNSKGSNIIMNVIREGKEVTLAIPPTYSDSLKRYVIGIKPMPKLTIYKSSYSENFKGSLVYSTSLSKQIVYGLKRLFTGQATKDEIAGPVRIVSITGEVAKLGIFSFIHFVALLSLSLGIFNLFPIPALDGGRLLFMGIEAVRGKPVDQQKEATVHFIGFVLLITLMLLVTYNDIKLLLGIS